MLRETTQKALRIRPGGKTISDQGQPRRKEEVKQDYQKNKIKKELNSEKKKNHKEKKRDDPGVSSRT